PAVRWLSGFRLVRFGRCVCNLPWMPHQHRAKVWLLLGCCLGLMGCGDDDAPVEVDAGTDAGGGEDTGVGDAGTPVVPECDSTREAVYETPSDLPAFEASLGGHVVRCAPPTTLAASRIQELATD